jgi:hypothetical protein
VFGVSTDPISGIGPGREPEGGTLDQLREKALKLLPDHLPADLRYIMDRAVFFFCRDSISVRYLKAQRVKTPVLEFGPDSQLGMTLRDDARGFAWLKEHRLEPGKFICVIPRLRYTPYYRINNVPRTAADDVRDAINERTTEKDHAKLREMIIAYVNNSGHKVMACAEMTYQVEMAKQVIVDPLPGAVKKNVVWRESFWLPDEAASIYSQAQAVISVECHSPLIALRNGTPAFYVRQPTDTCKGEMYRDFGARDWLFEIDQTTGDQLWTRLAAIHRDPRQGAGALHNADRGNPPETHGRRRQAGLPPVGQDWPHSSIAAAEILDSGHGFTRMDTDRFLRISVGGLFLAPLRGGCGLDWPPIARQGDVAQAGFRPWIGGR